VLVAGGPLSAKYTAIAKATALTTITKTR